MNDMYKVMNRINDIKKKFRSMRHNKFETAIKTDVKKKNYESIQNRVIKKTDNENRVKNLSPKDPKNMEIIKGLVEKYSEKNNMPLSLVNTMIQTVSGTNNGNEDSNGIAGQKDTVEFMNSVIQAFKKNR